MRVALFHNLPAGGAKRHTFEQIRELSRRGYVIEEFTFSTSDRDFMPWSQYVRTAYVYPLTWTPLRPVKMRGAGPCLHLIQNLSNLNRLDRVSRRIATDIDGGDFDLVLAKDCMFTVAPQIMQYARTPCVFYAHSLLADEAATTFDKSILQMVASIPVSPHAKLVRRLHLRNLHRARLVLTNSRSMQESLAGLFGVRSVVVYPGVDANTFTPCDRPRRDYLLSAGAIVPPKGHDLVIEAVGLLDVRIRPKLIIAGSAGDQLERDRLQVLANGLSVEVSFQNVRNTGEMVELYQHASALVVGHTYSYLGNIALEALACGTPVVAVNPAGMVENVIHGETGILVKQRSAQAIADGLAQLLADRNMAENMGRRARASIKSRWTWARAVDDLERQLSAAVHGQNTVNS